MKPPIEARDLEAVAIKTSTSGSILKYSPVPLPFLPRTPSE